MAKRALVTGAGGFIGHHLVTYLRARGFWVRGVDLEHPRYETTHANEFIVGDLRKQRTAREVMRSIDQVYALAADMGGMGYLATQDAGLFHHNALINLNTAWAAKEAEVERYFFASSACVYPSHHQTQAKVRALKESDAFPADPPDSYGWEKLNAEKLLEAYHREFKLETRIARFHNIYGPLGSWNDGREKAPAALCRKIAEAKLKKDPQVEIWGDGKQTRSFCYIDDCLEGIYRLTQSGFSQSLNLGQDELISIAKLADKIAGIAGHSIQKKFIPGPQGVRGRNSDNRLLKKVLDWSPEISLDEGLKKTYDWIESQVRAVPVLTKRGKSVSRIHA